MMPVYDKIITLIDSDIIRNKPLCDALDALENIHDHCELWIDALKGDLEDMEAASKGDDDE